MTLPCPICGGLLTRTIPVPPANAVIGERYQFVTFELGPCPCTEAPMEYVVSAHQRHPIYPRERKACQEIKPYHRGHAGPRHVA